MNRHEKKPQRENKYQNIHDLKKNVSDFY